MAILLDHFLTVQSQSLENILDHLIDQMSITNELGNPSVERLNAAPEEYWEEYKKSKELLRIHKELFNPVNFENDPAPLFEVKSKFKYHEFFEGGDVFF